MMTGVEELLHTFENQEPEIVLEWKDTLSDARGWAVINSLRKNATRGKLSIRENMSKEYLIAQAKLSELKYTISGPPIGGAALGIKYDHNKSDKQAIIERFLTVIIPLIERYCGIDAGENVDENMEITQVLHNFGLLHPMEGVVYSYFYNYSQEQKLKSISRIQKGSEIKISDERFLYNGNEDTKVIDILSAWGIAESVRHYFGAYGGMLNHKYVIIQGWNSTAANIAYFMCMFGARIVGIISDKAGIIKEKGLGLEEIKEIIKGSETELIHDDLISFEEANNRIWDLPAEVFIPCADYPKVSLEKAGRLIETGIEIVCCASNHPFDEEESYYGKVTQFLDDRTAVIPEFLSNCGVERVDAYLMKEGAEITDTEIIKDVSEIIKQTFMRLNQFNPRRTGIAGKTYELSLTDLIHPVHTH